MRVRVLRVSYPCTVNRYAAGNARSSKGQKRLIYWQQRQMHSWIESGSSSSASGSAMGVFMNMMGELLHQQADGHHRMMELQMRQQRQQEQFGGVGHAAADSP